MQGHTLQLCNQNLARQLLIAFWPVQWPADDGRGGRRDADERESRNQSFEESWIERDRCGHVALHSGPVLLMWYTNRDISGTLCAEGRIPPLVDSSTW